MSLNRVVLERWADVAGYESLYEVSDLGRVRSKNRKSWNGKCHYERKGKVLKQTKTTTGYLKVELYKDGERKSKRVHRLVGKAFVPKIKGKNLINHKDGNPLNNNANNLEWCNQSENIKHAYETGLMESNFTKYKHRISKEYVENKGTNIKKLSKKYGCSDSSIRRHFNNVGIKIRGISHAQDVYKIDRKRMVMYFEEGLSNKDIAEKLKTNNLLIGTYRYKYKKGELKI